MTNPAANSAASIRLRGHSPRPAELSVEPRSRQTRLSRTIATLLGFLVLAPAVFFIPPHFPWAITAVLLGSYFAYKQWTGEYIVHSFSGACPRCGTELKIEPGSKIRLPLQMDCYACHHKPELRLEAA